MERQEQNGTAGMSAFGRYLMQERELRGLTHEEVTRLTKLAPGVIEALESGQPERMPPRAYLIGYLRSYAGAVGLDPDEVVLRWQEATGASAPGEPIRPRNRRRRRAALVIVLAAAALAGMAALGWIWRASQGRPEGATRGARIEDRGGR